MGWQTPGLEPGLKCKITSLANMEPGDFIFFSVYALARLVLPLSSFFLTLLEYYRLQLQHLSPTPSHWWQSSSTYVRYSWGCGY
jgi:hypothetical protein